MAYSVIPKHLILVNFPHETYKGINRLFITTEQYTQDKLPLSIPNQIVSAFTCPVAFFYSSQVSQEYTYQQSQDLRLCPLYLLHLSESLLWERIFVLLLLLCD